MAHELWLVEEKKMTNITPLVGTINWRGNKDELGDEVTFDIAFNDSKFFPSNTCDLGDIVVLKNGNYEITRAVIVEENKNGRSPIGYTAFDYAFYLNKSNATYQFNKMSADQALKKIFNDFNIPIGKIISMPTRITKIFNDEKVSEIIKKIIKMARQDQGVKYLMEMRQGNLFIEKQTDLMIKGSFKLFNNGTEYDVTSSISNPTRRRSIADMINSIQVVSSKDKLVLEKADTPMINKFGKLQKIVKLDEKEKLSAEQIAQNELKELSKIVEEVSIDLLGDDRVRAGRLFKVKEPITGISGTYLIKDVDHTINGGIHKMKLGLEGR